MIEIVKINEFKSGIYIVIYNIVSPCGCTVTRKAITINSDKKPTKKQIIEEIFK